MSAPSLILAPASRPSVTPFVDRGTRAWRASALGRGTASPGSPSPGGWQGREEEVRAGPSHSQPHPPALLPASEGQREAASPRVQDSVTGGPPFGSCPAGLCHPSDGAEVPGATGRRPCVPQPPCPCSSPRPTAHQGGGNSEADQRPSFKSPGTLRHRPHFGSPPNQGRLHHGPVSPAP